MTVPRIASEYPEHVLLLASACPLMTVTVDRQLKTAQEVMRWAILREHENHRQKLSDIRERYCRIWKSLYYPEYEVVRPPDEDAKYWEGPRAASGIGKRIHDFVVTYEILQPVQPYELILGERSIRGEYALVRKRNKLAVSQTEVLVLERHRPLHYQYPDMLSLARWVHARRELMTNADPGIMHQPLFRGDAWHIKQVNESLAVRWLEAVLDTVTKKFAAPGSHCSDCVRHDCLAVLNDPNQGGHKWPIR